MFLIAQVYPVRLIIKINNNSVYSWFEPWVSLVTLFILKKKINQYDDQRDVYGRKAIRKLRKEGKSIRAIA